LDESLRDSKNNKIENVSIIIKVGEVKPTTTKPIVERI